MTDDRRERSHLSVNGAGPNPFESRITANRLMFLAPVFWVILFLSRMTPYGPFLFKQTCVCTCHVCTHTYTDMIHKDQLLLYTWVARSRSGSSWFTASALNQLPPPPPPPPPPDPTPPPIAPPPLPGANGHDSASTAASASGAGVVCGGRACS